MRRDLILVGILSLTMALVSVHSYAGAWNDGSRLATVESLVDHGTFAIDDSIFVRVPAERGPYESAQLRETGTLDKLLIDGHFYSDKSPVPAVLLAGAYGAIQLVTDLRAVDSPDVFSWLMNFLGAGLPFVIATVAMYVIFARVGLAGHQCWLLLLSFALTTVAPAYAEFVNNHMMLLAVCALVTLLMVKVTSAPRLIKGERGCVSAPRTGSVDGVTSDSSPLPVLGALTQPRSPSASLLALGTLAGLGYTIDLGLGPMLLAAVGAWVAWQAKRARSLRPIALFAIGAMPWLALHHAINYTIAGTFGPANANPAFFNWPGCPFDTRTMTGRWQHANVGAFLVYALDMLVGQRGFLGHNLPLYAAVFGLPIVLRRCRESVVVASLAWCILAFAAYAATSNNYSGLCLSVRWFVPMLAPGFLILALLLRERPDLGRDVALLSAFNFVSAIAGWWYGPWDRPPLALYWTVMASGLITWGVFRLRELRRNLQQGQKMPSHRLPLQFSPPVANNTVCNAPSRTGESDHVAIETGCRSIW